MKKSMKAVSVILALTIVASMTACSSKNSNSGSTSTTPKPTPTPAASGDTATPAPETKEPITLRVFQWELDNKQMDWKNLWFYQQLEEKTGVKVDFEAVKESDYHTKYNLMMASGDYPDVLMRGNIGVVNVEEYGVTQGVLVPLDDYVEENMPNYYSRLGMNNVKDSMVASDGKMYYVGNLTAQNINHDGNHYINKTWLDKVGMDIPTTIDELTEVLKAFRDQKPNGADTVYPMSGGDLVHQTQGLYTHFANFGVPLQRWVFANIVDGKVTFPGYMEGFRPALEWFNMLYNENLLDKESITQDSNVWATKMNADQVGYTTYLRLINTQLDDNAKERFVSIIPPASEYGVSVPRIMEVPDFGAAITIANKHIPETLQWLDAMLETETMMTSVNGPIQEGGPIDPTMKLNDQGKYEIIYIPENDGLYNYVPVAQGLFFAPGDYYFNIYDMPPHRIERYESSKAYEEAGVLEKESYYYLYRLVKLSSEESAEKDRLATQIETFLKESIANFIANGVTDASWNKFLSDAKSVGVDDYVAIYQKAYDEYKASNK